MLAIPTATATRARTIGTRAATIVPKATTRMTSAASDSDPLGARGLLAVEERGLAAELGLSARRRAPARAPRAMAAAAGRPSSVDGTSRVISA